MDPHLYKDVEVGNLFVIKQFESQFYTQLTPNGNTVLHIVADFCDSYSAVQLILKIEPNLLLKSNAHGEIPLHVASRKGHANVVQALIDFANQSSTIEDTNSRILTQEDTSIIHMPNNANESPFYIAAEKGHHGIAAIMLSASKSPSSDSTHFFYDGGHGSSTALHAAARRNHLECVELILENLPFQTKRVDEFGWTPLHYAARFNHLQVAEKLLLADRSMAYTKSKIIANNAKGSGKTALHIAITYGHLQMIEEILSHCPDSWEMVTSQGKNVIHLAVESEAKEVLKPILDKSWALDLINQKDNDGNTPLHLYAATKNWPRNNNLFEHPKVDKNALNNAGLTPLDLIRDIAHPDRERKIELKNVDAIQEIESVTTTVKPTGAAGGDNISSSHELQRKSETYLVVATLIITISFTAAFAVPGGYGSSESQRKGIAVHAKNPAFLAFIICDALAMMSAVVVVEMLLLLPISKGLRTTQLSVHWQCKCYIGFALLCLGISFVTGLYVSVPVRGIRIFLFIFLYPLGILILDYIFPDLDITGMRRDVTPVHRSSSRKFRSLFSKEADEASAASGS